jgi:hypothetical protein
MSPKRAQRFWDNDLHKQKLKERYRDGPLCGSSWALDPRIDKFDPQALEILYITGGEGEIVGNRGGGNQAVH